MKMHLRIAAAVAIASLVCLAFGQKPAANRLKWWSDARFGMFIHWGPVSLSGQEISWARANTNPKCPNNGPIPAEEYDNFYKRFNPTKFNAKEWVRIAKDAGMKYMVLTAKHCDGFLLWDSKASDYNIMNTPFKRDVCAELAKACHEAGMKIGWYFSPMDWKDPDCRNEKNAEFVKRMQLELRELLSKYGKIDLLWFDTDGCPAVWDQAATYKLVKELQPNIIINNRLNIGEGVNAGSPDSIGPQADYYTPEQYIGGFDNKTPWESCMTMSARNQWSYGGPEDGVKPLDSILEMLVGCAGGGGNVLLNVGPTPEGEIPANQTARLKEIGAWMRKNGNSIYRTVAGPYKPSAYGYCTQVPGTVFLHLLDYAGEKVVLPALPVTSIQSAESLDGRKFKASNSKSGLAISPLKDGKYGFDTVVRITFDTDGLLLPAIEVKALFNRHGFSASASNVYQNNPGYAASMAADSDRSTRWATDNGTHQAWLELRFDKPVAVSGALVLQAYPELHRVKRYAIEFWDGSGWKACYEGKDLPARLDAKFKAVKTSKLRLNILEATEGPTIFEFRPIVK